MLEDCQYAFQASNDVNGGATAIVSERGKEAEERVRELTHGLGAPSVLECVGLEQSTITALNIARAGGAIGRVGLPKNDHPGRGAVLLLEYLIAGGPVPARAYIEGLLPDVLEGRIEPGRVFDLFTRLGRLPDGYQAMDEREAIKVLIEF